MSNTEKKPCCRCAVYGFAIVATLLIVGWLTCLMVKNLRPAPVGEARAEERRKALAEVRATASEQLAKYDWQDPVRKIVHLPIGRAMELTVHEWQNPAEGRAKLLAHLQKATAPLPKAPEKPSEFE